MVLVRQVASQREKSRPCGIAKREPGTVAVPRVTDEDRAPRGCGLNAIRAALTACRALSPGEAGWFDLDDGCPIPLAHGALLRFARLGLASDRRERPQVSGGKDVSRYVVR